MVREIFPSNRGKVRMREGIQDRRRGTLCPVEKGRAATGDTGKFQNETSRVCSGLINSYAIPRQRILRVMREFTKLAT